jgi:hypothetical protein
MAKPAKPSKAAIILNFEKALALVEDAMEVTRNGLRANPSKEEERKLNKMLLRFGLERAALEGMITAIRSGEKTPQPPTKAQVDAIAKLTGEVDDLTTANTTASGAISIATRVLELAAQLKA